MASDPFKNGSYPKVGRFHATAYGPPWEGMQGPGKTASGVVLKTDPEVPGKKVYGIAMSQNDTDIVFKKHYYIWPNPFEYEGTFQAFDKLGGQAPGNQIDFYDWRGQNHIRQHWNNPMVSVYAAPRSEGGPSGDDSDDSTTTRVLPYEFKVEAGETFWDAIQRLAQEDVEIRKGVSAPLGWRGFIQNYKKRNGKLGVRFVFAAEDDLLSGGHKFTVNRTGDKVVDFSFDWDQGKPVAEATLTMLIDRWAVDPGDVIGITHAGPASGRWLVSSVRRSLFSPQAEITLKQPMPQRKEPAPETETVDSDGNASEPGEGTSTKGNAANIAPGIDPSAVGGGGGSYGAGRGYGGHAGVDISMPEGTSLYAICDGVVKSESSSWYTSSNGKGTGEIGIVSTKSCLGWPKGTAFGYGHTDVHGVRSGDKVNAGDYIGKSGAPGGGAHLHFFIHTGGVASGNGNTDPTTTARKSLRIGNTSPPAFSPAQIKKRTGGP